VNASRLPSRTTRASLGASAVRYSFKTGGGRVAAAKGASATFAGSWILSGDPRRAGQHRGVARRLLHLSHRGAVELILGHGTP
jgi:hypothetical protein